MAAAPHIFGVHNEGPLNTDPSDYVIDVLAHVHAQFDRFDVTPSNRVVRSLQAVDSRIQTKGFRRSVLESIFESACVEHYETEERFNRVRNRATRWFGRDAAKRLLIDRVEILDSWKGRDARMVPDAFLVDAKNKTVVCYEIEDTHPLNPNSIGAYAGAWYTLEYIYWDLHLIAYDIYGHPKVIVFPHAELVARRLRMRGSRTTSEA